jgi:trehalose 6-phosphate phosphatase
VIGAEADALRRLLMSHQSGALLALLFDYDGTLTPIVPHPWLAELAPETRLLLGRLAKHPRVRLGFLSGRALDELIRMVGLADVYYCGTSGLELDLRGKRVVPPQAEGCARLTKELAGALENIAAGAFGSWIEKKPFGLTVHYRAVAAALIPAFREKINHALHPFANRIRIVPGPAAIEITPNVGWNKGSAVRMIVQDIGPGAVSFYAGDHVNDNEAMQAVLDLGGVALGIGPSAPLASCDRLLDPSALIGFLQNLVERIDHFAPTNAE